MPEPLLSATGLSKTYATGGRRIQALAGVNVEVRRGECLAVVGESGSGKTTLGRLILGIETATAGTIRFDRQPLPVPRPRPLRRKLQLVQQNPYSALNPRRTIAASVGLPLAVHRLVPRPRRRERVAELLEMVGLAPELMQRYPHALSGGQCQRVALARALAAEPALIVLDEPTSSLDVSVQARVLELLHDLQQRLSLTYLFITHDLAVVRNMADRVLVLLRGRVVEEGETSALFAAPRHIYTRTLLASVPVVSEEEERLKPPMPEESV